MNKRMNMYETNPEGFKAMLVFDKYLSTTKIQPLHKELIKIRASQINGCAYCLDMHSRDARTMGETEQRIYTLSAWHDTPFFTEEEQAIIALTEEVTLIHNRVSDVIYQKAVDLLGEEYISQVIMAIIIINSWNRISITTKLMPELLKKK